MNIHLYHSDLTHETRINRITSALAEGGVCKNIEVVGKYSKGLRKKEKLDEERSFIRLETFFTGKNSLWKAVSFFEWNIRVVLYLLNKDISLINAHSLTVLPLSVLISTIKKSKIVYEPHELETESSGKGSRIKKLLKYIEKALINKADLIYTVGEDISEHYKENYALNQVHTVLNVPEYKSNSRSEKDILRVKFGLGSNDLLFIYQGLMTKGRGVLQLLDCFSKLEEHRHLILMGYGPLEDTIKNYAIQFDNIHFVDAVPQEQIIEYTSSADVGICYLTDDCLSYKLSLPNKLFEYMHSGLPVIINEIQASSRKLIEENNCGFIVRDNTKDLISSIMAIEKPEISRKSNNILQLRNNFCWEVEKSKLIQSYSKLLNHDSRY